MFTGFAQRWAVRLPMKRRNITCLKAMLRQESSSDGRQVEKYAGQYTHNEQDKIKEFESKSSWQITSAMVRNEVEEQYTQCQRDRSH
jgi:hypothetical protein